MAVQRNNESLQKEIERRAAWNLDTWHRVILDHSSTNLICVWVTNKENRKSIWEKYPFVLSVVIARLHNCCLLASTYHFTTPHCYNSTTQFGALEWIKLNYTVIDQIQQLWWTVLSLQKPSTDLPKCYNRITSSRQSYAWTRYTLGYVTRVRWPEEYH